MTSNNRSFYLIDSNVILDIVLNYQNEHLSWSVDTLSECAEKGHLVVNQIIYAEVAQAFSDLNELESALTDYDKFPLPWEAGFIASKAYSAYRKNGGKRSTLMPDFYIGAHALYADLILVTRDSGYQHYFPNLRVINPH